MPRLPFPDSYLVPGTALIAGEYPFAVDESIARQKLAALLDAGVQTIIDLTTGEDGLMPYAPLLPHFTLGRTAERIHIPVADLSFPDPARMIRILDCIDSALATGQTVYVHCWGGVGRTGTVIGCWLVRRGVSGDDALAEVNRLFATMSESERRRHSRGSPETPQQRDMVRGWAANDVKRTHWETSRNLDLVRDGWRHDPSDGWLVNTEGEWEWSNAYSIGGYPPIDATERSRIRGCLLGGAVGDALGAPVEFMNAAEIARRFGPGGPDELAEAYGRVGAITDDTQMTLWTAEGVLRGIVRGNERGIGGTMSTLPNAYLRWLYTQDGTHRRRRVPRSDQLLRLGVTRCGRGLLHATTRRGRDRSLRHRTPSRLRRNRRARRQRQNREV